ncbi:glycerophosphodiester phosphodiesterase 1 isoform X2 [Contarinia nasturtii]|uniref:glycerophosphodiester phosphodiesterase 1 isoform X2 n=1 Tax=Contarinia nasturtii TaxID=265458 RepID=UPI0012D3F6E3|nr:glycerophosphodiester phosphodiesterase 1 isoform X2 [Contarinia nasturtii]
MYFGYTKCKCVAQSCTNILLDVNITKCGQLVILHEKTLHRLDNSLPNGSTDHKPQLSFSKINSLKFDDLKSMNIAKNHPLCEKQPNESILQFNDLMHLLDMHEKINIFLLMGSTNQQIVSNISRYFENNPERFKRIIVCSRSPKAIFQLRKQHPQFICALWLDKVTKVNLPSILLNSPFFSFLYGLLYRNIIAVLTGISAVFINKHDFNEHIGQMWRQSNIQPIVYTLNSPNEKRYFQHTLRTQYLTDSLRSEPSNFVKIKK